MLHRRIPAYAWPWKIANGSPAQVRPCYALSNEASSRFHGFFFNVGKTSCHQPQKWLGMVNIPSILAYTTYENYLQISTVVYGWNGYTTYKDYYLYTTYKNYPQISTDILYMYTPMKHQLLACELSSVNGLWRCLIHGKTTRLERCVKPLMAGDLPGGCAATANPGVSCQVVFGRCVGLVFGRSKW